MSHHNAAEALQKMGRRGEALEESRRARPAYEAVVAMSPSSAWVAGLLGRLYVQTADLEYPGDRGPACELYGKAVEILEAPAGSDSRPEGKELILHARDRLAACRSRP